VSLYQEKLKDPRWLEKRIRILIRDGSVCQYCLAVERNGPDGLHMEVHHFEYSTFSMNPWDVPDSDLITLCSDCHDSVMKAGHRHAKITGARERLRMKRRSELRAEPHPEVEAFDALQVIRENDHDHQVYLAAGCNCIDCREETKL
jgi:hypothetical protein